MLDRVYVLSLGWRLLFCFFSPKSIKVHKILHFTLSLSSTAIYCPLATITAITVMTIPFHSDTKQDLYRGHKFLRRRRGAMRVKRYMYLHVSCSFPLYFSFTSSMATQQRYYSEEEPLHNNSHNNRRSFKAPPAHIGRVNRIIFLDQTKSTQYLPY